ncbi:MAG: hypothetical protein KJP00_07225 [Bacteroidia bacterium]|nr:hypothetical protein [Bacteroidia bacterium]
MIKFFRKLRQRIFSDNSPAGRAGKLSKYSLYAIGEIVLVVIGILIALSINNWNESRKLKEAETKYLLELKSNLLIDLEDINHSISFTSDKIKSNQIVLEYLDGEQTFQDTLKKHFGNLSVSLHFTPQTSAIEGIKTAEGINIIKNDSLRKALSYTYDFMYKHIMYVEKEDEHRFQYNILRPALNNNLKLNHLSNEAEPIDNIDIKQNQSFRNVISSNVWYKKFLLSQYKLQYKTVSDLIQLIEDELEAA